MAVITLQTTTNPFSGESFETAVDYEFDQSKILYPSITTQSPNSSKAKFQYRVSSSIESLPFESAQYSWVFVDNTPEEVVNGTSPAPVGLTINYVAPIDGIALIAAQGEIGVSITLSSPDDGVQVWSIENIVNPTGGGGVEYDFSDAGFYYIQWTSVGATTNGTITFDVKLTIGSQSATKPIQIVVSNI